MTDNDKIDKKSKGTKKCIIKKRIKFDDYKNCLLNDKVILKSQQRFISNKHDVYTENINKIALSNNIRKNIFACLFSVHNTISLSRHEQVCSMRLRFERYFSHTSRDTSP